MTRIDGRLLSLMVVNGARAVTAQRVTINRINVFPVADRDTGTNMALSLEATAAAIQSLRSDDVSTIARAIARASVLNAKGNSGIILAHWFQGLSHGVGNRASVACADLPHCLALAAAHAYRAVEHPVEGTMLTVMRVVGQQQPLESSTSVATFIARLVDAALVALEDTRHSLPVLRSASVVDAGASGFVTFLEGSLAAARGEPWIDERDETQPDGDWGHDISRAASAEQFCTELVILGTRATADAVRAKLRGVGSSLVVASTGEAVKVHVHTNLPSKVIAIGRSFGDVKDSKIDDLWRPPAQATPVVPFERQGTSVAIVADSTSGLPDDFLRTHHVEIVPLQLLFGNSVYRDQLDMTTADFYARLESGDEEPTTSQPSPGQFLEALDRIRPDRSALVLTLGASFSGTLRSAQTAARLCRKRAVHVYDSRLLSLGFGLLVANATRYAETRATLGDIVTWLDRWRADTGLVFTVRTLRYLRRSGRVGIAGFLLGELLQVRPVLAVEDGRLKVAAKARGDAAAYESVAAEIERRIGTCRRIRLGLIGKRDDADLRRIEERLRSRFDIVDVLRAEPTSVVGVHAGPGAWGVAFQRVVDGDPLLHA